MVYLFLKEIVNPKFCKFIKNKDLLFIVGKRKYSSGSRRRVGVMHLMD